MYTKSLWMGTAVVKLKGKESYDKPRHSLYSKAKISLCRQWSIWTKLWFFPDVGKGWGQEKTAAEDEMVGWRRWINGRESEQTQGDSGGQRRLVCRSSRTGLWLLSSNSNTKEWQGDQPRWIPGPHPWSFWFNMSVEGGWEFSFLTSSQVMLISVSHFD